METQDRPNVFQLETSRNISLVGRIFLLIGNPLLVLAIVLSVRAIRFGQHAQSVVATVVDRTWSRQNRETVYTYKVRFTDSGGNSHTGELSKGDSITYHVGSRFVILFDSEQPSHIAWPGFFGIYGGALIALGLGGGSVLVGMLSKRLAKQALAPPRARIKSAEGAAA